MIIKQTAQSIKRKNITQAKAAAFMVLIVIVYCIIYSVSIMGTLLFVVPLSVLSIINFIKSTFNDAKLLSNRKELEISDEFISFRKYKNERIGSQKKYSFRELRSYRDSDAYIYFNFGTLIDKQVVKFEYESQDMEVLRTKLKQIKYTSTETPQKRITILKIIWIAMLISLVIFVLLGQYMIKNEPMNMSDNLPIQKLRYFFYVIPILILIGILFFRKVILSKVQYPIYTKYKTLIIVSLGLAWSVGLIGLAVALISNRIIDLYFFALFAAFAMYYYRPKDSELEAIIKQEGEKTWGQTFKV
ncbi:MAG: hypothetical protein AB1306_06805 [Nitrospirota bacterium]